MKKPAFHLAFIFFLIFCGCKKETDKLLPNQAQNLFFDSCVQFLKTQLSLEDLTKLKLENKKILRFHGENFGVQIFEKNESSKKYLLLKKDTIGYSGNWVDMSGLKRSNDSFYVGFVNLENINKKTRVTLEVEKNKVIQVTTTGTGFNYSQVIPFKQPNKIRSSYSREELNSAELPEIIIYWGGPDQDFTSLFWLFDQDWKLEYCYYQGGGSDGGGSSAGPYGVGSAGNNGDNVTAAPTFISPINPISDIKAEIKCFSNSVSATYSISINVNQPSPGTRDVFAAFSSFRAGHTFLTLEQHNTDGSSIIRNIGFYPKYSVKPGDPIDVGTFGDDSNTPFAVSLKINVSGSDFINVINSLENQPMVFNLDNFNCTNSAMAALKSININLPSTISKSALFSGNDPGDLGEDIRSMDINNFSANNGSRAMTRTASKSNNQSAPPRSGGC